MEIYLKKEKKNIKPTLKFITAAIVLFAATLLFLPEAGILRTLPFFVISGAVCELLKMSTPFVLVLAGTFNLCMYLVRDSRVWESVLFSVVAMALILAGMYFVKLISLACRTQKKPVRKKCIFFGMAIIVFALAVQCVFCGNVVSFIKHHVDNTARVVFINKHLGVNKIDRKFTCYEFTSGEYRTYTQFNHNENVVGADNECYISRNGGVLTDCVRDYYEEEMLKVAENKLAQIVMNATKAFEITASDISFEEGEILDENSQYGEYQDRIGYVVSFYSILDNENDFLLLCHDTVKELSEKGFEYDEIVFCAGTSSEVLFCAQALPGISYDELYSKRSAEFDDKFSVNLLKKYGVTEKTILGYWNND